MNLICFFSFQYVGESERAIRQIFQRARNSAPCVIFFDEIDSICPKRSGNDSGSGSNRVVNQLLTEMDGVEGRKGVYVMGATNRVDMLDAAVLRPGRLTNHFFVDLPTAQGRVDIRHFSYFFKKAGLSVCAMIVVLFIIAEGFNTGASILLGLWADKINELEGRAEKEDHMFYIYWFSGIIAAIFVFGALRMFAIFYNCALASKKIHDATLTSLFHSPMSFFDTNPTGRILNRFSSDMDMIDLTMPFRIGDLLECLATTIAILGLVAWNAPAILILLAPLAVLCVFIQIFFGRTKRQLKRLDAVNRSPIYAHFSETIQGTSVIRAYKSEERYKGRDSKCD